MHEFSIVQSLLEIVEEQARLHGAKEVKRVHLLVGVLSGVEPHLLELAFETLREGTVAQRAELKVEIERLRLYCRECGRESEKEELNALCPHCQSLDTEIRGGQELLLKSLELEL